VFRHGKGEGGGSCQLHLFIVHRVGESRGWGKSTVEQEEETEVEVENEFTRDIFETLKDGRPNKPARNASDEGNNFDPKPQDEDKI
jgi:hypothetical protein